MAKNKFHDGPGPSQRQLRVGEQIRRTLSEVLARGDVHDPDLNRLSITVGEVRVSPDLKIATAYVLPLGGKGREDVLKLLSRNKGELRKLAARKLGLKFSPDLRFQLDETFDRMDETRRMLNQDAVRRDLEKVIRAIALLLALTAAAPVPAVECRDIEFDGSAYTICEVDAAHEELRLFLNDPEGRPYGHFSPIDTALAAQGDRLAFAMNAGMYHDDRTPVGYYLENGRELMRVVPNAGPGNFGLLPNGILCIRPGRADVIETLAFVDRAPACTHATQSGPMLVIDGELHPRFLVDSTSRYVRNGVGTSADGQRAVFAISRNAVTFHAFGRLFRDGLGLPSALYFDGNVSRLYAPSLGRNDAGFALGPVVGVVERR